MPAGDFLVLEDGTGVDGANTWISLVYIDQYHLERDRTAWAAATEEVRVAGMLLAAQWIVASYTFAGSQTDRARLPMPASAAFDSQKRLISGVPVELQRAQAELAFDHALGGNPVDSVASALEAGLLSVKTGPVALTFSEWAPSEPMRLLIDRELAGITTGRSGSASAPIAAGFYAN